MRYAILAASVALACSFGVSGCGSCQRSEESASVEQAPPKAVKKKQAPPPAEQPVARKPAPPTKAPQAAPTPPAELLSDCFVFVDAEPDYGDAPLTANFTTELECDNQPVSYNWDFGDGTTGGNEANPSHTYDKEGDYIAVVTVKTNAGEVGTDEIDIFVDAPAED